MLCPMSVFATDVTGGETCDTNVLNTDTGPVNLRAEFEPETIDLRWYNNNTLLNVTSTNSNTCTYDTAINLPTNPTRPGYKFKGWKIRPEYDFDQLDASINGIEGFDKGKKPTNLDEDYCRHWWPVTNGASSNVQSCNNQNYTDLYRYEWKTVFSYGTIYGTSKCVPGGTSGDNYIDNAADGDYCHCKVTGYKPNNSNIIYGPQKKMKWVGYASAQSTPYCLQQCATYCVYMSITNGIGVSGNCPTCRSQLFGQSQN